VEMEFEDKEVQTLISEIFELIFAQNTNQAAFQHAFRNAVESHLTHITPTMDQKEISLTDIPLSEYMRRNQKVLLRTYMYLQQPTPNYFITTPLMTSTGHKTISVPISSILPKFNFFEHFQSYFKLPKLDLKKLYSPYTQYTIARARRLFNTKIADSVSIKLSSIEISKNFFESANKDFAQQVRIKAITSRIQRAAVASATISFLCNVTDILDIGVLGLFLKMGQDVGTQALIAGLSGVFSDQISNELLKNILCEGAGVIIFGLLDGWKAAHSGDWTRVGLNFGVNVIGAASAYGGSKAGAAVGSVFGPYGIIVGTALGGLAGAFGGRFLASKTSLGNLTPKEQEKALIELKKYYDEMFKGTGFEFNISEGKSLEAVQNLLSQGKIPLIYSSNGAKSDLVWNYEVVQKLYSPNSIQDIASIAKSLNPNNVKEGLISLKAILTKTLNAKTT